MENVIKKQNAIGCCGIDCGLCPRFHVNGDSACPGCGGLNFKEKHPSCSTLRCCTSKNGLEVCAECKNYPCEKFNSEQEAFDSFVTHRNMLSNLNLIKRNGIEPFVQFQSERIKILTNFLTNFNDGRSKSFFCLSCTLLPLDKLKEVNKQINSQYSTLPTNEKTIVLKEKLQIIADDLKIKLKLISKNKTTI